MKRVIIFALTMSWSYFSQAQPVKFCPFGDKYYPKCDDHGNWDKCMEGVKDGKEYKYVPGLDGTSKTCVCEKLGDKYPDVVALKKALAKLKASDAEQYKKLAQLAEKNNEQDARLNDHEIRIKGLETWKVAAEEEIKNIPRSSIPIQQEVVSEIKKEEETSSPYIPPPPPPDTAKADTIVNGRLLYIIEPFAFVAGNKSPAFPSSTIWGAGIETGISIIWKERFTGTATVGYLLTPSFIPETGYSAYGEDKVSIHGLTVNARVGYKLWPFLGINSGYSWSPEKELPDTGGFLYLEAETPLRRVQFLLQAGVTYMHDLDPFVKLALRLNFLK